MASSRHGQYGQPNEDIARSNQRTNQRTNRARGNMAHSTDAAQRIRNEGMCLPNTVPFSQSPTLITSQAESWVEISSQPSSSSLSSIDNEVVTTGLRVQPSHLRRSRRQAPTSASRISQIAAQRSTSSQDEYDESESSSDDRDLTSSNEHIPSLGRVSPRQQMRQDIHFPPPSEDEDEDSRDEDGTALGIAAPAFTPQPNAFSHPPNQAHPSTHPRDSYFPPRRPRPSHPSPRAANDAALRASLTTLLSCALAARSLPKAPSPTPAPAPTRNEFQGLRLVPESELLAPPSPSTRARSSATASSQDGDGERGRRRAAAQGRAGRRKRAAVVEGVRGARRRLLSPTLMTWLVSAGVVIIVSVVGFGAGYALGYEAGRQEGGMLGGCGREMAGPRVKRFRWGGGSGVTV